MKKQTTLTTLFGATAPSHVSNCPVIKKNKTKTEISHARCQPSIILNNIPTYFVLEWIASSRTFHAKWYCTIQENKSKISQINWRINTTNSYVPVHLYATDNLPQKSTFDMEIEPIYSNVSYQKSHLQKCIRKGRADLAVLTAKHFMKLNMVQFIRRLFIISLEDVDVFSNIIPVLAWFTAIGNNPTITQPSMEIVEYLLGVVHSLCKYPKRWRYNTEPHYLPHRPWSLRLQKTQSDLIWSLSLRHSYGGMHGDLQLIENAIDFRAIQNVELHVRPIIWDSVYYLPHQAWDTDAIDFHVAPCIITHLQKYINTVYNEKQMRDLIWNHGSKTNWRDTVEDANDGMTTYTKQHWKNASYQLKSLQRFLIKNNS